MAFHRDLVRWYRRHHRELPWRATRDPYKIWVSEIMLQQTRVEIVRDYYRRWIRALPTVETLAKSPGHHVLKLWEGLGYYTRAKNLHRAAKILVGRARLPGAPKSDERRRVGPAVPTSLDALLKLPGVGRYTAGAIASIAFGQRVPLVDGNVARVLARVFGIGADVTKAAGRRTLWALAGEILPATNPGTFNQALMELGALVCTPVNPRCTVCPLRRVCLARAKGQQNELPNRGRQRAPKHMFHNVAFVRRGDGVLLRRRPARGLLAGLWELPPLEKVRVRQRQPLLILRHAITNKRITLRVFSCESPVRPKCDGRLRWASRKDLTQLTLSAAHRRAVERVLSADQRK